MLNLRHARLLAFDFDFRICLLASVVLLIVLFGAIAAYAGTTDPTVLWYQYVCGNDGAVFKWLAHYAMYPAFAWIAAGWAANSKTVQASPVLGPLARFVAGHYAGWLREAAAAAAKSAPVLFAVMFIGVALSACAGGTVPITPQSASCALQAMANAAGASAQQSTDQNLEMVASIASAGAGSLCTGTPADTQLTVQPAPVNPTPAATAAVAAQALHPSIATPNAAAIPAPK